MNATTGIITAYYDKKGFGFIFENDTENELFFHVSFFRKDKKPDVGDICEFTPFTGRNGEPQAKNINIIAPKGYRIPPVIGITSWVGPKGQGDHGEYGFLNYVNDNGGDFIHKSHIVNGLDYVKRGHLYYIDVAKRQGKPVCVNAHEIN